MVSDALKNDTRNGELTSHCGEADACAGEEGAYIGVMASGCDSRGLNVCPP